jgi:ElaA protein
MITWLFKRFDELSLHELYAILRLRNEVFAVEQNCVYPDMDNKDQSSYHVMGWKDDKLLAYTRIMPPGIAYTEPSIGRVATSSSARGEGIGKKLMERSIEHIYDRFGNIPIKISAQLYLIKFYKDFGFRATGPAYLEDGIEHIEMVKS